MTVKSCVCQSCVSERRLSCCRASVIISNKYLYLCVRVDIGNLGANVARKQHLSLRRGHSIQLGRCSEISTPMSMWQKSGTIHKHFIPNPTESPFLHSMIEIIMRPIPMRRRSTRIRTGASTASTSKSATASSSSSKVTRVLLDIHRAHPVKHGENEQVQRQTVHGEEVPARARLQHQARDLENRALRQTHAFQRAGTLAAAESGEGGDVALVRGAVAVEREARGGV